MTDFRFLGHGLGLRTAHYQDILDADAETGTLQAQWFEALSENYMGMTGVGTGPPLEKLQRVRERFPVVLHGVSMSIGSTDPLNRDYLKQLKALATLIEPQWVSDHLCWTGVEGRNTHDLLPLPYTREAIDYVVARIQEVQEFLGRRILMENVSSYAEFEASEMPEWEFVAEVAKRSGCGLLLDLNNIHVSAFNHGYDPLDYLSNVPLESVAQIHLAGPSEFTGYMIDTHDHPVPGRVWDLYREVCRWSARSDRPISAMVEWDDRIPPYAELEAELMKAKRIFEEEMGRAARG